MTIVACRRRMALGPLVSFFSLLILAPLAAQNIELSLERGSAYSSFRSVGPLKIALTPHIAAWLEDDAGVFLKTVYVSLKDGKQDRWVGKRSHPLPVWEARHGKEVIPDAVSGSSPAPKAPSPLIWRASLSPALLKAGFRLMLEVNLGLDYNSTWPEKGKDIWGQPSLIYALIVPPGSLPGAEFSLKPEGASLAPGGSWAPGLAGFTSALDILSSAKLRILE